MSNVMSNAVSNAVSNVTKEDVVKVVNKVSLYNRDENMDMDSDVELNEEEHSILNTLIKWHYVSKPYKDRRNGSKQYWINWHTNYKYPDRNLDNLYKVMQEKQENE